jgi:hypothetical protein
MIQRICEKQKMYRNDTFWGVFLISNDPIFIFCLFYCDETFQFNAGLIAIVLNFANENGIKENLMQFITYCPFCFECESSIKRGMKTFSSSSFHSL